MKKTKCKNYRQCGNTFFQYSTINTLCYNCKKKKHDSKRKPERIQRSLKRKAGKTDRQKARDNCDYLWSQIIKIANPFCWFDNCGRPSVEACHVHSRRFDATRWNVNNGMGGCKEHHRWETDNPKDAKPLVIEFIGAEMYEELRKKTLENPHFCSQDYKEIEKRLKKTLKYYLNKMQ